VTYRGPLSIGEDLMSFEMRERYRSEAQYGPLICRLWDGVPPGHHNALRRWSASLRERSSTNSYLPSFFTFSSSSAFISFTTGL
jgi:hypothetical protein